MFPFSKGIDFQYLRNFNLIMASLHALQGVAILLLSTSFSLPVTAGYLTFDFSSQALVPSSREIFSLQIGPLVALFFFLSAAAHLIIATLWRASYEEDLKKGMNRVRWIEYALSVSVMMVAIALLVGIYELTSLIMIFALVAVMNLMGLMMEVHNQTTEKTSWLAFKIGSFAGIVPWVVVGLYFWAASAYGEGDTPTFVYWIYISIFVFFNCFAINMYLQYKRIGKWKDYIFGERVYMVLSLVAKSALAWQVFAGTLRP
ncbi:MAG: heliorhodopsin HeR [bacterium]|nr:heliorhodopsin HeR [bacterium]